MDRCVLRTPRYIDLPEKNPAPSIHRRLMSPIGFVDKSAFRYIRNEHDENEKIADIYSTKIHLSIKYLWDFLLWGNEDDDDVKCIARSERIGKGMWDQSQSVYLNTPQSGRSRIPIVSFVVQLYY